MPSRTLPVKLTVAELATKSSELTANVLLHYEMQEKGKAEAKLWKERVDASGAVVKRLARITHSGVEDRIVTVDFAVDLESRSIITRRVDTGETVESRAMTASEFLDYSQGKLFEPDEEEDDADGGLAAGKAH